MKTAILSDIHANIQALEAVLRDCEAEHVETFWLLGDYVDYCAATVPVLQTLQSLNAEFIIAGNHDACLFLPDVRPSATPHGRISYEYLRQCVESEPQDFVWLKSIIRIPLKTIKEKRVMLVHGTPDDPYWGKFIPENPEETEKVLITMKEQGANVLFMGHSHSSFMLTKDGCVIVNAGSVGQPRNGCPHAQYVIFEDGNVEFRRVPYDVEAAVADIQAAGLPRYLGERLLLGR